jgi:APA family basic amino acid/polyamine antiporter
VGWEELSKSDAPLALAASKVLGSYGKMVLTALALIATTNTVLMMLISGSRIIFGIAKNVVAIPSILSEVHYHRKTPWLAIVFTTSFTLVVIILYSGRFSDIAEISVFSMLIVFSLVNLAVIALRFKRPDMNRPFMSPFKIKKFPILPGLGLIMTAIIIFQFKPQIIFSTIFPLVSISILCLILMKRASAENLNGPLES